MALPSFSQSARSKTQCPLITWLNVVVLVGMMLLLTCSWESSTIMGPGSFVRLKAPKRPPPTTLKRPISIGCMSTPRTGSTVLFNLVRVLFERLDPNVVTGFETDIVSVEGAKTTQTIRDIVPHAHGNLSVVYKTHTEGDEMRNNHTDFYIRSYRDPYQAVCSHVIMFSQTRLNDPEKRRELCRRFARRDSLMREMAAEKQALHVDFAALKSGVDGMVAIIDALLEMWGVEGYVDRQGVAEDVLRLKAPPQGIFYVHHFKTLLHSEHVRRSKTNDICAELRKELEVDPICRAWHDEYEKMFAQGPIIKQTASGKENVLVQRG